MAGVSKPLHNQAHSVSTILRYSKSSYHCTCSTAVFTPFLIREVPTYLSFKENVSRREQRNTSFTRQTQPCNHLAAPQHVLENHLVWVSRKARRTRGMLGDLFLRCWPTQTTRQYPERSTPPLTTGHTFDSMQVSRPRPDSARSWHLRRQRHGIHDRAARSIDAADGDG